MPPAYSAIAKVTSEILHCYTNPTPKIQLIKILANHNCNYEKVVFPQQRILLPAIPDGYLEVYVEKEGKKVLEKVFSTQELPVNQPQKELATIASFY